MNFVKLKEIQLENIEEVKAMHFYSHKNIDYLILCEKKRGIIIIENRPNRMDFSVEINLGA